MKYIKCFESFSDKNDITDVMENIAGLIETYQTKGSPVGSKGVVGGVSIKWALPNFDPKKIIKDEEYKGQKNYIQYFVFAFYNISNFYNCESSIKLEAKRAKIKYFIANEQIKEHRCHFIGIREADWDKLDIEDVCKSIQKVGWDVLLEEDLHVNKEEFDIIYEDEDILAVKPKTYRSAIKYSADAHFRFSFKKELDWIEKYLKSGSYYGGFNWYKSKTITKEVDSWWRRLLRLPKKKKEEEIREFIKDFPRYLLYIVEFKKYSMDDPYRKLYLLYDISRAEYGQDVKSFSTDRVLFGNYWGDKLDSAHNQLKIANAGGGKRVTLRDIWSEHGSLFNRAFSRIESDMNSIKEDLYDTLGIWADIGGEYKKDALAFIRDKNNRLTITRPDLVTKDKDIIYWNILGYYDDPKFDWWNLDKEKIPDRIVPEHGYKDFFAAIGGNVKKLQDAIDKEDLKK